MMIWGYVYKIYFPLAVIVTQVIFFAQLDSFLFWFGNWEDKKTPCATIYENILSRLSSQKLPTPTLSVPRASFVSDASEYCDDLLLLSMIIPIILLLKIIIIIMIIIMILMMIIIICQVPSLPTVLPRPAGSGQRPPPQPPARLRHRHHQVRQARQGLHLQPDRQGNGPDQWSVSWYHIITISWIIL